MSICAHRPEPVAFFTPCPRGCLCRADARKAGEVAADQLRDLIALGVEQPDASRLIWGDRTTPEAVRLWVRRQYAAAFTWLVLPPLEKP
jgi:hypothetical protein